MSTDVYIDFDEPQTVEARAEANTRNWCPRIGHLGVMQAQFHCRDILEPLRVLNTASGGRVLEWVPEAAERLVSEWREGLRATLESHDDDGFWMVARVPRDSDWEDAPDVGELRKLFVENIGRQWSIRVD